MLERVNVREKHAEELRWLSLEWFLVQILVEVAITQLKNLWIEVEKGFRRTMFGLELVDPNVEINFVKELMVRLFDYHSSLGYTLVYISIL